jgi:Protein of unknown function (DUF2961)
MAARQISKARRSFLKDMATVSGATAAVGLPTTLLPQARPQTPAPSPGAGAPASSLAFLPWYARAQTYRSLKQSSYDTTGGNGDRWPIEPGGTIEVFGQKGPGVVSHIWFTIAAQSPNYLKELVLRAWWDGEEHPSIEAPVGDFFGLNLGQNFVYESAFLNCSPIRALNCYLAMPYRRAARMTVTNEGALPVGAFYSNIDFQQVAALPDDTLYLHASYRQSAPSQPSDNAWKSNGDADRLLNPSGKLNYVYAEARGRGHLMGVTLGILQNQDFWAGEGDDMIFVDDEASPIIVGTGSEDYFCGAWNFGGLAGATPFAHLYNGAPYILGQERVGGRYVCYRWHADNPVTFTKSLRHTMEHGHANHRADSFYSCCYWYQTEPHQPFPALAPVTIRIPRVIAVDVNGVVRPT